MQKPDLRLAAALLASCGLVVSGCAVADADPNPAETDVVFTLLEPDEGPEKEGAATLSLTCDGEAAAEAELHWPDDPTATVSGSLGDRCVVEVRSESQSGVVDEIETTVSDASGPVERHVEFDEAAVETGEFAPADGDLTVEASLAAHPEGEAGSALTVMASNIWLGGMLSDRHDHDWGADNRDQIAEFFRSEDPDVLFAVETYGAAEVIEAALNEDQPDDRQFSATRITTREDDNLWLFTWLEVEEEYIPSDNPGGFDSFHFGGARLGLPDGGHVHAFNVWLTSTSDDGDSSESPWTRTTRAATEEALDLERSQTDDEIVRADEPLRLPQARELLDEQLPSFVDDDAPVILGGDFNTQSPLDWSSRFADAPGHEGLTLDWPVMQAFDDADFVDTYRHANPDAARHPGRTWAPAHSFGYAPGRIDYVLTRGDGVQVLGSSTRAERLSHHQGDEKDRNYPFYSDHAAVVTQLVVRGDGPGPDASPETDAPEFGSPQWPDPVPGEPVPPEEMSAEADSVRGDDVADNAVDGDAGTVWHSYAGEHGDPSDPADPFPHTLTVDMGAERELEGLRYVPRVDGGTNGLVVEYTVRASVDGDEYEEVAAGTWDRDPLPKDVELDGVSARYLQFEVDIGVAAFTHVAELIPYE